MRIRLFGSRMIFFVMISLFLACFEMRAMQKVDEDIPMEGELGRRGMRSIDPQQSVHAVLSENNINIEFFKNIPLVTISIKNSNNTIVYTNTVSCPQYESISLEGLENGSYTLELSTDSGYMYGTFMYVY